MSTTTTPRAAPSPRKSPSRKWEGFLTKSRALGVLDADTVSKLAKSLGETGVTPKSWAFLDTASEEPILTEAVKPLLRVGEYGLVSSTLRKLRVPAGELFWAERTAVLLVLCLACVSVTCSCADTAEATNKRAHSPSSEGADNPGAKKKGKGSKKPSHRVATDAVMQAEFDRLIPDVSELWVDFKRLKPAVSF